MVKAPTVPHQRTSGEGAQSQCFEVDLVKQFGISGEQELKTAVQSKAFYLVGPNPPARRIFGLQQLH
jgi:hypothetical protein